MLLLQLYNRTMTFLFMLPLYMIHLTIIFHLCDQVLGTKEGRKKWIFWSMVLLIFIMGNMPRNSNEIKYLITLGVGIWLFRGRITQKICVITFGWLIWIYCLLSADVFLLLIPVDIKNAKLLLETIMVGGGNLLIYAVIRMIGDACQEEDFGKEGWLFTGSMIVTYLFMAWDIDKMDLHLNREFLGVWFMYASMMVALNVIFFIYYEKNILKRKQIRRLSEFEKKNELEQAHYQRLEEMQTEFRSLAHDMNRYLSIFHAVKSDKEGQAIQYELAEEIKARIEKTSRTIYCERPVLNAILNEKYTTAKEKRINFQIFVEPGFDIELLDDFALIGILSNLIDNALEAVERRQDEKWITVRMFAVNDGKQKFIRIENSMVYESNKKSRVFFTKKENKKQHGFGLKNVQKLVEENHGNMKLKAEEERFMAELIF